MSQFKTIVYTSEQLIKDEIFYLNDLLASGLSQLHLRKPKTPKYVLENLIMNIDPRQHHKLVIHSHYDLLDKYQLKGIHFTKKFLEKSHPWNFKTLIEASKFKKYTLSKGIHSIEELDNLENFYDFVSLSPVFDSISKENYIGKIEEFRAFYNHKNYNVAVYALGGINLDNFHICKEMGFDGAIFMGSIWKQNSPTQYYKEILNSIYQID